MRPGSPGLWSTVVLASALVAGPIWFFSERAPSQTQVAVVESEAPALTEAAIALASADPLQNYFGLPLAGQTIGYVVDGDSTMAGYIDQVAFLTNNVNAMIPPGSKRFGIAQPVGQNGQTRVEVAEPTSDLEGAKSLLLGRLPSGKTDLTKALAVTANWYPDQVFMVLAKPVDAKNLNFLVHGAEQTGAIVNVIALGAAAKQAELASISTATGGKFVPVNDETLNQLVESQKAALTASPRS